MRSSSQEVRLVGILNVTPDSFSDGGLYVVAEKAAAHAAKLAEAGASILDIGAESTRPGATPISWETEWARVEPILKLIRHTLPALNLSLDTRHPETARRALELKLCDWINDVGGLKDPEMIRLAGQVEARFVFMHNSGIPADRNVTLPSDADPVTLVLAWAEEKLQSLVSRGIPKDRLIFDPGIGFGKTARQSEQILREIHRFKTLGVELYVGHSRKSFLELFSERPAQERDSETLAASIFLASQGVDYLRVHNVELHARVFHVLRAFQHA